MSEFNIEDLEVLIARSREGSLAQMLALQLKGQIRKSEQLAAENVGLNKFIIQSCYVFDGEQHEISDAYICATDGGMPETPATDAFQSEVRAQARNDFIGRIEWIIRNECNPDKTEAIINELQNFSEELKLEAAQ